MLFPAEQVATQLVVAAAGQQDMTEEAPTSPQDIASPKAAIPFPLQLTSGLAILLRDDDTLDTTDPDLICLCWRLILLLCILLFAISLVVVKSVRAMMVSFEIGASDNAHGMSGMLLAA